MRSLVLGATLTAVLTASTGAGAHITLDEPPQRDATMKTPPCGGTGPRSASPPVFAPGARVTVKWHETIAHPGFFRIALSTDGTTFPADPPDPAPAAAGPVLAIVPKVGGTTAYSQEITLPDAPCETCTIQVIQYMRQHAPPPYYYQCADIAIREDGSASNDAGEGTEDDSGIEADPGSGGSGGDGGCAVARPGTPSFPALWLAALCAAALRVSRRVTRRGSSTPLPAR